MISLGSDHGGYELKEEIIKYKDYGTENEERTDYPIFAERVAKSIQSKECDRGILICKSGAGMTIVANKFKGIRAALGINEEVAMASKADDNINVVVLPAQYITLSSAIATIRAWIATEFKGGRYLERLQMIKEIEKDNMK